jgi:hypothetical protein
LEAVEEEQMEHLLQVQWLMVQEEEEQEEFLFAL